MVLPITSLSALACLQGEPPNMDGLIFDFEQKPELGTVYSQRIHSGFTPDQHFEDAWIRVSHIWGWLSRSLAKVFTATEITEKMSFKR
jgi:hypothetical protein